MKQSLFVLLGVAGLVACSSSSSDPTPTATDAGADASATGTSDAGADAAHAVTACTSKRQTSCLINGSVGGGGCGASADNCDDGHTYAADCDGDGNCVCSFDGVPDCTCSTGIATCDGGSCDCPLADGFCCFTGTAVVAPGP